MPGETIHFHIHSAGNKPYDCQLVRIRCADPNPDGPGYSEFEVASPLNGRFDGTERFVRHGSYGLASGVALGKLTAGLEIGLKIMPTLVAKARQCILSFVSDRVTVRLMLDGSQGITLEIGAAGSGFQAIHLNRPILQNKWYSLSARFDPGNARIFLSQVSQTRYPGIPDSGVLHHDWHSPVTDWGTGTLSIAAQAEAEDYYNGKIEAPILSTAGQVLHHWDFAIGIDGIVAFDTAESPRNIHLFNLPTRAVKGYSWSGRHMKWTDAPDEYAAIHFHDTDFDDCCWPASISLIVPKTWKSGLYAVRLRSEGLEDYIPFCVRPLAPEAPVALLLPTFTYQVYANNIKPGRMNMLAERARNWGALVPLPDGYPGVGRSCYDRHSDGTGVSISSLMRPMLDARIKQNTALDAHGAGASRLVCDSYIIDWLEHVGQDYDVITDHDLHSQGARLLKSYTVVITGQHPEYYSTEMLDGLQAYLGGGGRLIYMGGNGFYWRVAHHPTRPAIEVRRAEGGIRVWESEPGEYYHAFNGEYGGLWRRQGRAPNYLVGVGFSAQGDSYIGYPYRFTNAITNSRVAFMVIGMDGKALPGEQFGEGGWMGGGAAGFEVDSADFELGTPRNALVIASGAVDTNHFIAVHEDRLALDYRKSINDLLRSDMTFFETPAGGAVFSVGSMTFVGSLGWNNHKTTLAILMRNVLNRFVDATPFTGFTPGTL